MKINSITDLDLSQYKIAHCDSHIMKSYNLCHDKVMAMAEAGITDEYCWLALIPKDCKLTKCSGDDWNDTPADCNASGFYDYPDGTIFLGGKLGQELKLYTDKKSMDAIYED